MKIQAYKSPLIKLKDDFYLLLDHSIRDLREKSIVVVTSKVISLCEGSIALPAKVKLQTLVETEADMILEGHRPYGKNLTIKEGLLIPNSGIDESNSDGYYVLWPKDPWKRAEEIRQYLMKRFRIKNLGVIITDSKTGPLRWGTTGVGIACAGFLPLKDYRSKKDLFNRTLEVTKASHLDGLAAAAVTVMGEGAERTPFAVIEDVPFVEFEEAPLTKVQIAEVSITIEEDVYGPLFAKNDWVGGRIKK